MIDIMIPLGIMGVFGFGLTKNLYGGLGGVALGFLYLIFWTKDVPFWTLLILLFAAFGVWFFRYR